MSVVKMKRCKECGRWFQPKSNKQQYCEDVHYRRCPVCGKPVIAKYLSDPARCCSGVCKSKLGKMHKEGLNPVKSNVSFEFASASMDNVKEYVKHDEETLNTLFKRYTGENVDGWESMHIYQVEIEHYDKKYVVKSVYDMTDKKVVAGEYIFTNKRKISTVFKAVSGLKTNGK